jgi:hypothetical protein
MTFDNVRRLALALPGVEDGTSYGTPALKEHGKLLCRLKEDETTLVLLGVEFDERDMLIESQPEVFFITDHYRGWPSVLAHLPKAKKALIAPLLERRWRAIAPKILLASHADAPAAPRKRTSGRA